MLIYFFVNKKFLIFLSIVSLKKIKNKNLLKRLRLFNNLILHPTAQTDDSHAVPLIFFFKKTNSYFL